MTPERRARVLLALGAVLGLATAVATLVGGTGGGVPGGDAVATVNGVSIRRDDYLRALGAVATDRRTPLDEAEKRRVLDRLIDEELLLQRGLALGLARRDRSVRAPLVAATIDLLARSTHEPSPAELRTFYDDHRDYFTEPGRLRVRQILVRTEGRPEDAAVERAAEVARRLRAGDAFDAVRVALGDEEVAPVPAALLPATKLREYVGETVVRAALECAEGEVTDPVRSSVGFHVLQVVERTPPSVPPFDSIVDLVRTELRRRGDDASLRASLDELRRAAAVHTLEPLP